MTRQAFVHHKKKLVLYWSPKAGCTALVDWFAFGLLGRSVEFFGTRTKSLPPPRTWLGNEGFVVDYRIAANLVDYGGYHCVAVARHPATRVLSAFVNKFITYSNINITRYDQLEWFSADLYRSIKTGEGGDFITNYTGVSFESFLRYLEREIGSAEFEPNLNHHWNTQVPFAYIARKFNYHKVFYLEKVEDAIEYLNGYCGTNFIPNQLNKTNYGGVQAFNVSNMSSVALALRPGWARPDNFLTKDMLGWIARIFKVDYDVFGYNVLSTATPGTR